MQITPRFCIHHLPQSSMWLIFADSGKVVSQPCTLPVCTTPGLFTHCIDLALLLISAPPLEPSGYPLRVSLNTVIPSHPRSRLTHGPPFTFSSRTARRWDRQIQGKWNARKRVSNPPGPNFFVKNLLGHPDYPFFFLYSDASFVYNAVAR